MGDRQNFRKAKSQVFAGLHKFSSGFCQCPLPNRDPAM